MRINPRLDHASLRPNPVRASLLAGGTAFGTMALEIFTPGLPRVRAQGGAEFCIFDMEHSGASIETMKMLNAVSYGSGLVPMVRVPAAYYHLIAPVLDAAAMGVMVPMIETRRQAEDIVRWCRYRPEGARGLAFGIGHEEYTTGDIVAKMAASNERTLVIALVEITTGIANVDEIMAVPGIDVGWLGHFDLTDSIGIAGQFQDPRFLACVDKLVAACRRNGKAAGFLVSSSANAREWAARSFRYLGFGPDTALLWESLAGGLAVCRNAVRELPI